MPEHITRKDRRVVESFYKIGEDIVLGEVKIDQEKCSGCSLCAQTCASGALEVIDKKARMIQELPMCMSCGDCVAICSEDAIEITRFYQFKRAFRELDRGEAELPRMF